MFVAKTADISTYDNIVLTPIVEGFNKHGTV